MTVPDLPVLDLAAAPANKSRAGEPVTLGIPWPRGRIEDASRLQLRDAHGSLHPLQARVLNWWGDGSARWTLLDFRLDPIAAPYRVEIGAPLRAPAPVRNWARQPAGGERLEIAGGRCRFALDTGTGKQMLHAWRADTGVEAGALAITARDAHGRPLAPQVDSLAVTESGPLRLVAVLEGTLADVAGRTLLRIGAELHFHADLPVVRIALWVHNPRRARHPGGRWPLGDPGSVLLNDLSVSLTLPAGTGPVSAHGSLAPDQPFGPLPANFTLLQGGSGGEHWDSPNHVNREGKVPNRHRGWVLRDETSNREGLRCTPAVTLARGADSVALAMARFWQNFPKALRADGPSLDLGLFPAAHGDPHELQGGERKTHEFWIAFGADGIAGEPLDWCRTPSLVRADPDWYAHAEAVPWIFPESDDPSPPYVELSRSAIAGERSFFAARARVDEYGWRHFGDLHADHEEAFCPSPPPVISHYNNQYDAVYAFGTHFLRSGDPRWLGLMDELARHVMDIDIYHTDEDKAVYNHGLFWHTEHYMGAGTSTHRSFPPASGVAGGGPSPEHLYTSGLLLHYFLTGCRQSYDSVVAFGEYVIAADDGRRTIFRFLDRGPTGLVSVSGNDDYHGPGRAPGNSLNALINAHMISLDRRFLDKAEELLRRCIHPRDDLALRQLEDVEDRWFYLILIEKLIGYIEHKREIDEVDTMHDYAVSSFLYYAHWALEHDPLYLSRPERLEYPTETWAAQDLRKSVVFHYAALLTAGEESARFRERGEYFFRESLEQLLAHPTRHYARPMILALTLGYQRVALARAAKREIPAAALDPARFGAPATFVSQKRRAIRRFGRIAWAASAIAAVMLVTVVATLL